MKLGLCQCQHCSILFTFKANPIFHGIFNHSGIERFPCKMCVACFSSDDFHFFFSSEDTNTNKESERFTDFNITHKHIPYYIFSTGHPMRIIQLNSNLHSIFRLNTCFFSCKRRYFFSLFSSSNAILNE